MDVTEDNRLEVISDAFRVIGRKMQVAPSTTSIPTGPKSLAFQFDGFQVDLSVTIVRTLSISVEIHKYPEGGLLFSLIKIDCSNIYQRAQIKVSLTQHFDYNKNLIFDYKAQKYYYKLILNELVFSVKFWP